MLARGDEAAVRAPGRRIQQREGLAGHGAGPVPSAAITQILSPPPRSEVKAMRRPSGLQARLLVEGQAGREPPRRPALDRHHIDVAEHVEGDRRPSGLTSTFIHVPSSVSIRHLPHGRAGRRVDVPGRRRGGGRGWGAAPGAALLRLGEGRGGHQQQRDCGQARQHVGILPVGRCRPDYRPRLAGA